VACRPDPANRRDGTTFRKGCLVVALIVLAPGQLRERLRERRKRQWSSSGPRWGSCCIVDEETETPEGADSVARVLN